jgi:carboxymethylenebutenolidase
MPGSFVTLDVDDSPMQTYVVVPEGDGPYPGVAVAQHRLGIDVFVRDICDRLAQAGFAAAAPDLYHRQWNKATFDEITGLPRGDERAEEVLRPFSATLEDQHLVLDMTGALAHLRGLPAVGDAPLGVLGFCQGGRVAYLMATRNASLKATACFYPGGVFEPRGGGPSPFAAFDRIESPVICFFGKQDENPSPEHMQRMDAELSRLGVEHTFHAYDGVGHAFMDPSNTHGHLPEVAKDAWSKAIDFFGEKLKASVKA